MVADAVSAMCGEDSSVCYVVLCVDTTPSDTTTLSANGTDIVCESC